MGAGPINLVVEDALSEGICLRLLAEHSLEAGFVYGKEGYGFIKSRLGGFNHAAKGMCYFVLTDLDRFKCAPEVWKKWLPGIARHPQLTFRVAVREVESWLLADPENLTRFFSLKAKPSFPDPDSLLNPKRELLELALKSPKRALREAVACKDSHGQIVQGPDYNGMLLRFVQSHWNIANAMRKSDSLHRAAKALRQIALPK